MLHIAERDGGRRECKLWSGLDGDARHPAQAFAERIAVRRRDESADRQVIDDKLGG